MGLSGNNCKETGDEFQSEGDGRLRKKQWLTHIKVETVIGE